MFNVIEQQAFLRFACQRTEELEKKLQKALHDKNRYAKRINYLQSLQRKERGKMKYVLIVSQYYQSYHCFIAEYKQESFCQQARELIEKLEDYKRTCPRAYYYGDLDDKYYDPHRSEFRLNDDSGDMYFIVTDSVNKAMKEAEAYIRKNSMKNHSYEIAEHHSRGKVTDIVGRYFTLL